MWRNRLLLFIVGTYQMCDAGGQHTEIQLSKGLQDHVTKVVLNGFSFQFKGQEKNELHWNRAGEPGILLLMEPEFQAASSKFYDDGWEMRLYYKVYTKTGLFSKDKYFSDVSRLIDFDLCFNRVGVHYSLAPSGDSLVPQSLSSDLQFRNAKLDNSKSASGAELHLEKDWYKEVKPAIEQRTSGLSDLALSIITNKEFPDLRNAIVKSLKEKKAAAELEKKRLPV